MNAEYLQTKKPDKLWCDIIKMLQQMGYSNLKIAKMMDRDVTAISRYLGNSGNKSMPVEMPPNGIVSDNLKQSIETEIAIATKKGQTKKAYDLVKIYDALKTLIDYAQEIDMKKANIEQQDYKRHLSINEKFLHPNIYPKTGPEILTKAWPTQDYMNFFIERQIYKNDGFALDHIGKKNESAKNRLFFIRDANKQLTVLHEFGITDQMLELMPENLQDLEEYLRQIISNYLSGQLEKNGLCKGFSLNRFIRFLSHIENNENGCANFYPNSIVEPDKRSGVLGLKREVVSKYEKIDLRDEASVKWRFCLQYIKRFVDEFWEIPDLLDKCLVFTRSKNDTELIQVTLSEYGKWFKKYIQELSDKKI